MANRERGEVDLTIDGKTYVLRLSTNAQAHLESLMGGQPFGDIMAKLDEGSVSVMRATLFVALREHQPTLSLDEVGDLAFRDRKASLEAIGEALLLAYPEAEKKLNPRTASGRHGAS